MKKETFDSVVERRYGHFMWTDSLYGKHLFCDVDHHSLCTLASHILNKIYLDPQYLNAIETIPNGHDINDVIYTHAVPGSTIVTNPTEEWKDAYIGIPGFYIVGIYQAGNHKFPEPLNTIILNMAELD